MAKPKFTKKAPLSPATKSAIEAIDAQPLPSYSPLTASERARAGREAAKLIESQQQVPLSEALGNLNVEGFGKLSTTQADRTRVGGGNIGGAAFPAISEAHPEYAGKSWGVMDYGTASRLTNLTSPETIWTTMLGSANQLKTNPLVFAKLEKQFKDSMKAGNLSPELEAKINQNLQLFMGEGADIRDPKIWKQLDTFEKRAQMADLMMGQGLPPQKGGVALGGEKSGKGVIFKPTETLIRETEPSLLHPEHGGEAPTFSIGPRLFTMEKEVSYRPDLHPGFPTLIHGKDLGHNVKPVPNEVALPDWHERFLTLNPNRKPGYYDLALGIKGEGLPSQSITEEYLTHLQKHGFADGGVVDGAPASQALADKVQDPQAAEMLNLDLARLATLPQAMAWGGVPRQPTYLESKQIGFNDYRHNIGMSEGGDMPHMAKGGKFKLPPAENAARTQIIGTLPTYQKAANIFNERGAQGRAIDFGAGLGEGAKIMGADTYEPFPQKWTPTYVRPEDVPSDAYGRLTNLNVLNVVPREIRDEIVQHIGRVLEPNGSGIITTRGKDVLGAKGVEGPEPMSIITSRDTYQKGFTGQELEDYLRYMLGDKFDVNKLNLGPAGAFIQKKAEGGVARELTPEEMRIEMMERGYA